MKVQFLNELQVVEIDDDDNWQLLSPFQASVDMGTTGQLITVPVGFKTDFASVPRIPVAYLAFGNCAHKPAVLHDYLYSIGGSDADRAFADDVLRAASIADGMSAFRAWPMWAAVRTFGGSHWKTSVSPLNYTKG